MNDNTPWAEYLIIGTHTATWFILLLAAIVEFRIDDILRINIGAILLLLPFAYILGMLTDSTIVRPLEPFRKSIKIQAFEGLKTSECKDESIALRSPELYKAYDARIRRVRILGASIFNWPLLALAVIIYYLKISSLGFMAIFTSFTLVIALLGIILCLLSIWAWRGLYRRAYRFRRNACETLFDEIFEYS
jgi:hypothetical protein